MSTEYSTVLSSGCRPAVQTTFDGSERRRQERPLSPVYPRHVQAEWPGEQGHGRVCHPDGQEVDQHGGGTALSAATSAREQASVGAERARSREDAMSGRERLQHANDEGEQQAAADAVCDQCDHDLTHVVPRELRRCGGGRVATFGRLRGSGRVSVTAFAA